VIQLHTGTHDARGLAHRAQGPHGADPACLGVAVATAQASGTGLGHRGGLRSANGWPVYRARIEGRAIGLRSRAGSCRPTRGCPGRMVAPGGAPCAPATRGPTYTTPLDRQHRGNPTPPAVCAVWGWTPFPTNSFYTPTHVRHFRRFVHKPHTAGSNLTRQDHFVRVIPRNPRSKVRTRSRRCGSKPHTAGALGRLLNRLGIYPRTPGRPAFVRGWRTRGVAARRTG
jgi:hypothetical protein